MDDDTRRMADELMRQCATDIILIDLEGAELRLSAGDPESLAIAEACTAWMHRPPASDA